MWEYKRLKLGRSIDIKMEEESLEKLNELGKQRWEMITCEEKVFSKESWILCVFKRQTQSLPQPPRNAQS